MLKNEPQVEHLASGYTATVRCDRAWWIGWVNELPGLNSQERTRSELLDALNDCIQESWQLDGGVDNAESALYSAH